MSVQYCTPEDLAVYLLACPPAYQQTSGGGGCRSPSPSCHQAAGSFPAVRHMHKCKDHRSCLPNGKKGKESGLPTAQTLKVQVWLAPFCTRPEMKPSSRSLGSGSHPLGALKKHTLMSRGEAKVLGGTINRPHSGKVTFFRACPHETSAGSPWQANTIDGSTD